MADHLDEKINPAVEHKEDLHASSSLESNLGGNFDASRTARLLRKMDWNIVPFLALLYLVCCNYGV